MKGQQLSAIKNNADSGGLLGRKCTFCEKVVSKSSWNKYVMEEYLEDKSWCTYPHCRSIICGDCCHAFRCSKSSCGERNEYCPKHIQHARSHCDNRFCPTQLCYKCQEQRKNTDPHQLPEDERTYQCATCTYCYCSECTYSLMQPTSRNDLLDEASYACNVCINDSAGQKLESQNFSRDVKIKVRKLNISDNNNNYYDYDNNNYVFSKVNRN
jgi:hypothetical protein